MLCILSAIPLMFSNNSRLWLIFGVTWIIGLIASLPILPIHVLATASVVFFVLLMRKLLKSTHKLAYRIRRKFAKSKIIIPSIAILLTVSSGFGAEFRSIVLTPEEEKRVRDEVRKRNITLENVRRFKQRLHDTPPWVEDRVAYAVKGDAARGFMREIGGIAKTLQDPDIMIKNTQRHFEQHGVVGGVGQILASAITVPYHSVKDIASGEWSERPFQTFFSLSVYCQFDMYNQHQTNS